MQKGILAAEHSTWDADRAILQSELDGVWQEANLRNGSYIEALQHAMDDNKVESAEIRKTFEAALPLKYSKDYHRGCIVDYARQGHPN